MAVLKALSERHRLRILRLLLRQAWSVNAIAQQLALSQYNVSKHLRVLREAGLVAAQKSGRQRFYMLAPALKSHLAEHDNELELDCCTIRFDKLLR